jgi:hypothetical protein
MKLRQLYNEIKLVPQNRILLQKDRNSGYYFQDNNKYNHTIYKFELSIGIISFTRNIDSLISFLEKKKIPFTTKKNDFLIKDDKYIVVVDAKYFITPGKLSEIKLVSMNKLPSKIKIYDEEDIDKYPSLKLHIITKEENDNLNEYLKEIDENDYEYEDTTGMTIYDASKKLDSESGYLDEWFTTIINGIFPDIITVTPYGTND